MHARTRAARHSAIEAWFERQGWRLAPFQRETIAAYRRGESGLLHAPTGSGKTLAAWLGPVSEALESGELQEGLQVLWITPLRALANDIARNLTAAARGAGLPWSIELRTGDTGSAARRRQRDRPPHALITTPESLSVMMSYADTHERLRTVRAAIVDEWHELLGSKRGVQLELCLARLRSLNPDLRTWGLSATLGNLEEALRVLMGATIPGRLVKGPAARPVEITSILPESIERFPWSGHLGQRLLGPVLDALERARTTLLFTNTRSQAELWYRAIVEARLEWIDQIAIHHGSIAPRVRHRIEDAIRAQALRCVVCTSSLDLGVDFGPVDQVIQVGSPKGVARLLQRAGRSGHQPEGRSRVLCVASHAFELVEFAAARRAQAAARLEARRPLKRSLDVLVQHLGTLAAGPGFRSDELLKEIRTTHAFAALSDAEWRWALDFLMNGGQALHNYEAYRRVTIEDGVCRARDARLARLHRLGIGTITSDAEMAVKWLNGARLGTVEEALISRLHPGQAFMFAGRVLELVRVRDMTAYVRLASARSGRVARWQVGRMPLSSELADAVQTLLAEAAEGPPREAEMQCVQPLLRLQQRWSRLPTPDSLLVEQAESREGWRLYVFAFAGRTVNEGLAALMAHRWSQREPVTFAVAANDYGAELLSSKPLTVDADAVRALLSPEGLAQDLLASLNVSEIARRQFRDIARVAGLVFQGYPGRRKVDRQLQASSGLMYDVLSKYDPGNLLLDQARREVFEMQLEETRLAQTLRSIAARPIHLVRTSSLTPLAFPLWAERLRAQIISTEDWRERIARMIERLERRAARERA